VTDIQIVVIAVIQGLTEFLPVSSSGHLVIAPDLLGWRDQGLIIDIAVHVGTLGAVIIYLWRDIWLMLKGLAKVGKLEGNSGLYLLVNIILGTIPIVIAGALIYRYAGSALRNIEVVAWATLGFAVLLYIADKYSVTINRVEHLTWGRALFIGMAQIFALIPGASRSGTVITMARWLGFERREAARFSLLLSIPAIIGAGVIAIVDVIQLGSESMLSDFVLAAILSFISALISVFVMMSWLRKSTFMPIIVYRFGLGIILLFWVYQ
tara:strand:- start:1374 stop:2171 length:798 start_codon:yes stop_codon:yes gene_type:complete